MRPGDLLIPLSWLYGGVIMARNRLFEIGVLRSVRVPCPVYSVGNMTAGGTGKTTLVANIVSVLLDAGLHPAVISRGYRRQSSGTVVVSNGRNIMVTAADSGDEPMMLAERFRNIVVIVDANRVRAARLAVNEMGVDAIVLDDGFQHRYLHRDKDIVLIDANKTLADIRMIPAGLRREPIASIKRADSVVFTKVRDRNDRLRLERSMPETAKSVFTSSIEVKGIRTIASGIVQPEETVNGKPAIVFCGIAKPESFRSTVEELGVDVREFLRFGDHHAFSERDIDSILSAQRRHGAEFFITTEKDAVRLKPYLMRFAGMPLVSVMIDAVIHQQNEWRTFILETGRNG